MIELFIWENQFLLSSELKKWKDRFIQKYGDFNLIHIKDYSSIDNNFIVESVLSWGFMWQKKLVILEDIPVSSEDKKLAYIEELLSNKLELVPKENIVLFVSSKPDKRWKFYKKLKKIANIHEFWNISWLELKRKLNSKYSKFIDNDALDYLIKIKWENYTKIASEIEKLLIWHLNISKNIIKENVTPEIEESIFSLVDEILMNNKKMAISRLRNLLNQTNIYWIYNFLLSNIRTFVYIDLMKRRRVISNKISFELNLWKRGFLVNKNYFLKWEKLSRLFSNLAEIDYKMKNSKLLDSDEKAMQYELEKVILSN
jgi:DNA polymerase III delta subunit